MLKKLSIVALAGLLSLPAAAWAGGVQPSAEELQNQIEKLTRELGQLRSQMEEMKNRPAPAAPAMAAPGASGQQINKLQSQIDENAAEVAALKDKSESWDLASRVQWDGDFRSRIDYLTADTPSYFGAISLGQGVADVLASAPAMGNIITGNGITTVTGLVTTLQPALAGGQTAFEAALTGAGAPQQSATALWNIFTNPEVNGLLNQLVAAEAAGAGSQLSALTGAFSGTLPLVQFMKNLSPAARAAIFTNMGYGAAADNTYKNDTMWENRLRLNLRVKATENVSFKGRLAMYKTWGMENNAVDYTANNGLGGGPFMLNSLSFDGNTTRQPQDNIVRVDRAYVNWTNIADKPVWFSIGRRPTTDGPPAQLRQGLNERMATPTAFMDYPFDGLTLGYAYDSFFGIQDFPGRIRFCYGRGFESGPTDSATSLRDVDFGGISWDVYHKGNRFFAFQSFIAHDIFNVPDNVTFPNPVELGLAQIDWNTYYDPLDPNKDLKLNRKNLGDIYHTTMVYMDKYRALNYFLALGWSHTDPKSFDELGTSLLSSFNTSEDDLKSKDGYSVYTGLRYDIPDSRLELGLEYNYGTKDWIGFVPGNDDLYAGKLATRGHVFEGYMIYRLPAGEKISKYADFFMRLGYMHYIYDYTGSGFWLGDPIDVNELAKDPLSAQFYTPIDHMDQVYLTLDTYF